MRGGGSPGSSDARAGSGELGAALCLRAWTRIWCAECRGRSGEVACAWGWPEVVRTVPEGKGEGSGRGRGEKRRKKKVERKGRKRKRKKKNKKKNKEKK